MRVVFFSVILLLVCCFSVSGQSEPQITQYVFASETYNPASLVERNTISLIGLHRQQWIGMPNAPQTTFFSANAPFVLFQREHRGGIIFSNDNAGLFSTQSVNIQYAYKYKLGKGVLGFGLNLGFISQTFKGDSVRHVTSDYHTIDSHVPTQSVSGMSFDMGLGVFYQIKRFHVGVSMLHLIEPVFDLDDNVESFTGRVMFFNGGYVYVLPNSRYKLYPTALLKTDFVSLQADLNLRLELNDKYWGGIGWRLQDAVTFMAGINLMESLSIGYSFDLATNQIIANSAGSHELFVRYDFLIGKKKTNKYKSIRIL